MQASPRLRKGFRSEALGPRFGALFLTVASFILWGQLAAHADDPAFTLPKDGAWARYRGMMERPDTGAKQEILYTVSFVGTIVENDEACRWIENKFEYVVGDTKGTMVDKLLVREKDLLENADPLRRVIRAWEREENGPTNVKELAGWDFDGLLESVLLRIPGTLKTTKAIDSPKDIDFQKGRLKGAHARTGERNGSTKDGKFERRFTFWNHADLPFGVAELEVMDHGFDRVGKNTFQMRVAYQLQDVGTDAKTELPGNN